MRGWMEPEPELSFGRGDRHVDPKAGLSLFGPFMSEGQTAPLGSINLGLIGARRVTSLVQGWLEEMGSNVEASSKDSLLFPHFPGFRSVFRTEIQQPKSLIEEIPQHEIDRTVSITDSRQRVIEAARLFQTRLEALAPVEPKVTLVVCAIPKRIEEYCWSSRGRRAKLTPKQRTIQRRKKRLREEGQLFLTDFDEKVAPLVYAPGRGTNFRSLVKASALRLGIPTQLIRETTLSGERVTQPRGTLAWNLSVGLYYKAGGYPWRLARIRENTCFVGISFYRERGWDPVTMGTSVAQVFDKTGEGLILKGARVEWGRSDRRSPHLNEEAAADLTRAILEAYENRAGRYPNRIVFHKSSRFWPEEMNGIERELPDGTDTDYVAVEQGDLRLVRDGKYPPLRGTCVALGDREYVVYGMGYIPYLNTYPGHHVPNPLHILEHRGEASPQRICSEILGLTKLNWNTAQFCCGVPITLNIARRVSSILAELPEGSRIEPSYRFYM